MIPGELLDERVIQRLGRAGFHDFELDPSIGLCQISKDALDALASADAFSGYLANSAGWFKGSAQMMQGMVFAVGGYEGCAD